MDCPPPLAFCSFPLLFWEILDPALTVLFFFCPDGHECIPVRCLPSALYGTGGSLSRGVSLTETPSRQRPPWTETLPWTETTLDRDPPTETPRQRPSPWIETPPDRDREFPPPPCGQTETCENITFANFVWAVKM